MWNPAQWERVKGSTLSQLFAGLILVAYHRPHKDEFGVIGDDKSYFTRSNNSKVPTVVKTEPEPQVCRRNVSRNKDETLFLGQ